MTLRVNIELLFGCCCFFSDQALADGLRTGETEWLDPLESTSAENLTKAYLEGPCVLYEMHLC